MRWLIALAAVIVVLVLELIAQIILPGLAADHVRDELQADGRVLDVHVSSFPALQLLVHDADSVTVRMGSYSSTTAHLERLLAESNDTATLDASTHVFRDGLLTLRDATLTKRDSTLTGTADVQSGDLEAASAGLIENVTPAASANGQLVLRGTIAGLVSGEVTIEAVNGQLLMVPNVPLGSLATVTLFSDPHVSIIDVAAKRIPDGFAIRLAGHIH